MCEPQKDCTCNVDGAAAQIRLDAADLLCKPHVYMRPPLSKDGDRWCALYGSDIQSGVCGFGETPEKAMEDFDNSWRTEKIKNPGKTERPASYVTNLIRDLERWAKQREGESLGVRPIQGAVAHLKEFRAMLNAARKEGV